MYLLQTPKDGIHYNPKNQIANYRLCQYVICDVNERKEKLTSQFQLSLTQKKKNSIQSLSIPSHAVPYSVCIYMRLTQ